jgi:hypothetical protein
MAGNVQAALVRFGVFPPPHYLTPWTVSPPTTLR